MAEPEQHLRALRLLELRLLQCSLPPEQHPDSSSPKPPHHLHDLIENLIQLIESGQYIKALSSDASRAVFTFRSEPHFTDSEESAHLFYSELVPECVNSFLTVDESSQVEKLYRTFVVMAVGVAALLAFTQCNITGPFVKLPAMPLSELVLTGVETSGGVVWAQWEAWAEKDLMSVGSDLCAKFSILQYIVFAKILLMTVKDLPLEGYVTYGKSISWWLARLLLIQQRLLEDKSSSLFDLLQVFMHESLHHFGTPEKVTDYWSPWLQKDDVLYVVSDLEVEAGLVELCYSRIDNSRQHLESAAQLCKLHFSLSGAMGFRTVHQVEPKAQLVLVGASNGDETSTSHSDEAENVESAIHEEALPQHPPITSDASDVLMTPRFVPEDTSSVVSSQGGQICSIASIQLKAVQQVVVLAECLSVERSARNDDLQKWKMAPYIEAIDSQQSSPFVIQYFCNILRIRWESTRSRTKQRALLMMENLVQGIYESSPEVAQRIRYCFGLDIPTIPALRKDYADLLVSCGLIGEALKVYEDLELWDNLIYCYRILEKKAAAVELIKTQLSQRPSDPRLWCSLGDVLNDDACYKKALEVSGNRSARALRSLARSAYNRGDYESSTSLWVSAMALNSLYPDGWFALGAAALKSKDVEKALDGFTRAVQLDPDNGEAWNNIACLHKIKKRSNEAFIAFKEALKFKRDSWQMWENYSHVAADVGNFTQAMEAIQKVLNMTKNKRIDADLIERVVQELEHRASIRSFQSSVSSEGNDPVDSSSADPDVNQTNDSTSSEVDLASRRETEHLIEMLGKTFRQIVQSGGSAELWGLYARWHKLKGDLTMCSEALLKQVRSYQGSDLWKDRDRFVKFARASLNLCRVYQELASLKGGSRELFAAEMHLKSSIKQAENFSGTQEFQDLLACLDEVQMAIQAAKVSPS